MLFIKRGYLLLLAGILIGFIAFSVVSFFYEGVRVRDGTGGMPSEIDIEFIDDHVELRPVKTKVD